MSLKFQTIPYILIDVFISKLQNNLLYLKVPASSQVLAPLVPIGKLVPTLPKVLVPLVPAGNYLWVAYLTGSYLSGTGKHSQIFAGT